MAAYDYRCPRSECPGRAPFTVHRPIGTAAATVPCPACGAGAVRVFSPPRLALAPRHAVAAIDRAQRSRTEPEVVSAPPAAPRRSSRPAAAAATNPAWRRLPRP